MTITMSSKVTKSSKGKGREQKFQIVTYRISWSKSTRRSR